MSRLTYEKLCEILKGVNRVLFILDGIGEEEHSSREVYEAIQELQLDWKRTSEEKPSSTRHVIVADGAIISHYGYYLKPKDKWFTDWMCEKEIDAPMFWMDVPEPPKESLCGECCAKMDEVE